MSSASMPHADEDRLRAIELLNAGIIVIGVQQPEGNRLRRARHHGSRHAGHGRAPAQRTRCSESGGHLAVGVAWSTRNAGCF
jgi:hypothetical protein